MIDEIELKYKELIDKAKEYMNRITDYEHDINHMKDVVKYTYELLKKVKISVNNEVCIIAAYWHDVGRIKCVEGHEKLSADMLKGEMKKKGYNNQFIEDCYTAIEHHKWNMTPENNEGLIVKEADKLAWIGEGRWKICLEKNQNLDSIIKLLPKLRAELLNFEESKEIYDRDIVQLIQLLYNYKIKSSVLK